jgi:hypothetical protein
MALGISEGVVSTFVETLNAQGLNAQGLNAVHVARRHKPFDKVAGAPSLVTFAATKSFDLPKHYGEN